MAIANPTEPRQIAGAFAYPEEIAMPDDTDRLLDADLGEQDGPDPGTPAGVVEVATDWEPPTDDETEEDQ